MSEKTFHLKSQDGTGLVGSVWEAEKPRAIIVWFHGFAEHRRRYAHFANYLNENQYTYAAIDVRGHGESQGKRGHVSRYEDYLGDAAVFLHWARDNYADLKCVVGAHSHGGLILTRYLEEGAFPRDISAAVITGPFMATAKPIPAWQSKIAGGLAGLLGNLSIPTGIPSSAVSTAPEICEAYANDPLIFGTATLRWLTEMQKNQDIAVSQASKIDLPIFMGQGMADQIVSPARARELYDNLGSTDKHWVGYEGMYHEILNEVERETVYKDIVTWLKKRV